MGSPCYKEMVNDALATLDFIHRSMVEAGRREIEPIVEQTRGTSEWRGRLKVKKGKS